MVDDPVPIAELRRALVIKLRHHGDVLLASPVFTVLKNHAPQLDIDALVYAETAPMLQLHPAIAEVHTIDRGWKKLSPLAQARAEWTLLRALRDRRYDLVVHLTEHRRGAWLVRLLGPRWSVAIRRPAAGKFWQASFSHLYAQQPLMPRHAVERNLDALRRIGIYPADDERRLSLAIRAEDGESVAALLAAHGLPQTGFVHFHPTSRWLFKCWPEARCAAFIRSVVAAGRTLVVTAAPDAREMAMVDRILATAGVPVPNLAGRLSLKQMAALSARAAVFVGVDSAPMHIAAAVGTPVVALFGPSGDLEWGPWRVPHVVVASDRHPCRPCGLDGCGGGKVSDCLASLAEARVLGALAQLAPV